MYKITHIGSLEKKKSENRAKKIDSTVIRVACETNLTDNAGSLHWRDRYYVLKYQDEGKICQHTIICPEFRDLQRGGEAIVYLPVFLLPRRPYPIEIYLYAIDLYSGNESMSQRTAAEVTRRRFGLKTFSHTTLGRALNKFVQIISEIRVFCNADKASGDVSLSSIECTDDNRLSKADLKIDADKKTKFPTIRSTLNRRKVASSVLGGKASMEGKEDAATFCHTLAKSIFAVHQRFLL